MKFKTSNKSKRTSKRAAHFLGNDRVQKTARVQIEPNSIFNLEALSPSEKVFYHIEETVKEGALNPYQLSRVSPYPENDLVLDVDGVDVSQNKKQEIALIRSFAESRTERRAKGNYKKLLEQLSERAIPFTIGETDPRVGLRGQKGLKAVKNITKGEILALYPGHLVSRRAVNKGHPYLLNTNIGLENMRELQILPKEIPGDAFSLGAPAHLVNASTTYGVFEPLEVSEKLEALTNVTFASILFKGHYVPFRCVIAIKEIEVDQEFLVDYGKDYWETVAELRENEASEVSGSGRRGPNKLKRGRAEAETTSRKSAKKGLLIPRLSLESDDEGSILAPHGASEPESKELGEKFIDSRSMEEPVSFPLIIEAREMIVSDESSFVDVDGIDDDESEIEVDVVGVGPEETYGAIYQSIDAELDRIDKLDAAMSLTSISARESLGGDVALIKSTKEADFSADLGPRGVTKKIEKKIKVDKLYCSNADSEGKVRGIGPTRIFKSIAQDMANWELIQSRPGEATLRFSHLELLRRNMSSKKPQKLANILCRHLREILRRKDAAEGLSISSKGQQGGISFSFSSGVKKDKSIAALRKIVDFEHILTSKMKELTESREHEKNKKPAHDKTSHVFFSSTPARVGEGPMAEVMTKSS